MGICGFVHHAGQKDWGIIIGGEEPELIGQTEVAEGDIYFLVIVYLFWRGLYWLVISEERRGEDSSVILVFAS